MKFSRTLFLFPFFILLFAVASQTGFAQTPEEPAKSERLTDITDDSFSDDVLQSDRPVLVFFWNKMCGSCNSMVSILDNVARDYEGRVKIAMLNVDENRDIPARFNVRKIPTLMLFKGGDLTATKLGPLTKEQLIAFLDEYL